MKHSATEYPDASNNGIGHGVPSRRDGKSIRFLLTLVIALAGVITSCGCPKSSRSRPGRSTFRGPKQATLEQDESHFALSLNYLDTLEQYDDAAAQQRILYHLIQWSRNQQADDDWIAEPLYARLPSRLGVDHSASALSRIEFVASDVYVLREAIWMRDLAMQIDSRPLADPRLDKGFAAARQKLGADTTRDLKTVTAYFDWVVRNVQLEASASPPADGKQAPPTARPGASRTAWEGLLLGRGDAWVRARIFGRIARQHGIPVVILAIDRDQDEPVPWVAAALIDNRLFLFDPQLGLPLPAAEEEGIATFSELRKNPTWLRQLDVGQRNRYDVTEEDLKHVVALIDAPAESLSQRMKLVELQMSGERRLTLVVSPSNLKKQLQEIPGLVRTQLWTAPYDALNYQALRIRDPRLRQAWAKEFAIFRGGMPLARARREHFRGNHNNRPSEPGAKGYYMKCRPSDAQILAMEPPAQLKNSPEWDRLSQDRKDQIMESLRQQMTIVKQSASYWLGLIAFDNQQYPTAINYFERRTLQANPNGPWTQGARYNLGRTYELLGRRDANRDQLDQARQEYRKDRDTPQRHGNLLRARWIDQEIDLAGQNKEASSD